MKDLKSKVIKKIEMNDDNTIIVFTTDKGEKIIYQAEGDCCSYSWFSHINNIDNLLDSEILDVDAKLEYGREATKDEYEDKSGITGEYGDFDSLEVYMYTFTTKKSHSDIEFRNDSNGYYGGSCEKTTNMPKELREIKIDL